MRTQRVVLRDDAGNRIGYARKSPDVRQKAFDDDGPRAAAPGQAERLPRKPAARRFLRLRERIIAPEDAGPCDLAVVGSQRIDDALAADLLVNLQRVAAAERHALGRREVAKDDVAEGEDVSTR